MPVKDRNPFGGADEPVEGAALAERSNSSVEHGVVKCPVCDERNPSKISTRNTPSQILRTCAVCGNQWSCGTVGGAYFGEDRHLPQAISNDEDLPDDVRLSGTERWFE